VARAANPIVLAVFNTDQVEQVVEQEILPRSKSGQDRDVHQHLRSRPGGGAGGAGDQQGLRFLETPVSGTSEQVRQGDGVGLIGGEATIAAEVDDVLQAMFPRRFHVGAAGDGGRTKLGVNLILGLNRLRSPKASCSRPGSARAACVPQGGAGVGVLFAGDGHQGPQDDRARFSAEGRARQTLKDVHLMLDQARSGPAAAAARGALRRAGSLRARRRERARQQRRRRRDPQTGRQG